MKLLKDVEKKTQVSNNITELVKEINKLIESSNNENLYISINFTQNMGIKPKNSYLNVSIYEIVSY